MVSFRLKARRLAGHGVDFRASTKASRDCQMNIVDRLPLIIVLLTSICAINVSTSTAQKFLGFGRGACEGDVKIPDVDVSVRKRESQIVILKRDSRAPPQGVVPVNWQCDGQPQPVLNCPVGTTKAMFDRTQGGRLVTIICLKR